MRYENDGVILKRAMTTPLIGTKMFSTLRAQGVEERLKGKENVIMDFVW